MTRDIPEFWIERLFARMSATYGARFADMWANLDLAEVKATWRAGLAGISDEGLKRGVSKLPFCPHPPDLPAFRRLCEGQPATYRPPVALADNRRADPATVEANLAKLREIVAPLKAKVTKP